MAFFTQGILYCTCIGTAQVYCIAEILHVNSITNNKSILEFFLINFLRMMLLIRMH